MTPPPSYRIDRATWIMARAFTPHLVLAPLALPWTLLSAIPGTLRRGLYLDASRTGMVMLYRSNPVLDVIVLVPVMIGLLPVYFAGVPALLGLILPDGSIALALGGVSTLFMIGLLFLLHRGGGSLFPWGSETPKGQQREVAWLALRVLETVPPAGAVVVATANSADLYRQYQAFGFTGGPKHRVHRVNT